MVKTGDEFLKDVDQERGKGGNVYCCFVESDMIHRLYLINMILDNILMITSDLTN